MLQQGNENRPKKKLITAQMRMALLEGEQHIKVELPQPLISMITINRPECKNLLSHRTRAQLFNQLQLNDQDPDVRVTIIRGAGGNFSAGNDFDSARDEVLPFFEPEIDGQTSRHVLNGWFMMNDLAKPVIAMVEGEAVGGGLELAAACDVCICAEDASIGYNAVRGQGLADYQILPWLCGMRNAMELILTNKPMTGLEAVKRGFATEAYPAAILEEKTLGFAARVAQIPSDLLAFNKKSVHRAFEAQGMRTNLRNGVDLEALMFKAPGAKMLTARRGPAAQTGKPGTGVPQRVPPPRPGAPARAPPTAVATQAVSASADQGKKVEAKPAAPAAAPSAPTKAPAASPVKAAAPVAKPAPVATPQRPAVAKPAAAKPVAAANQPEVTKKTPKVSEQGEDVVEDPMEDAKPISAAKAKPAVANPTKTPIAKPAVAKPTMSAAKPAAKPVAAATASPAKAVPAKVSPAAVKPAAQTPVKSAKSASESDEAGSVHVHLHESVHIHIGGGGRTPSKL